MVDRYLLPVPKTKNSRMYVRFPEKRKRFAGLMFVLSLSLMTFQINRYLSMKIVGSKPSGYYMDWDHRDAPKKVRYFSSGF